jgi:hypothetical protein
MSIRNKVFVFLGFLGALYLAFLLRPRGIPPLMDFVPLHTPIPEWDAVDVDDVYEGGERLCHKSFFSFLEYLQN